MDCYGFVYITTNLHNGKKYIGQTQYRKSMRASYLGSGKVIRRAIRKYGREAFFRETVFIAFTKDDLDFAERQIIADHDAVVSDDFYNIAPGGRASLGFTGKKHTAERNSLLSKAMKTSHHSAQKVTIDDITYNSLAQAAAGLGTSLGKIKKFVETGVHPSDQIHAGRGRVRGTQRSTRTTWVLTDERGRSEHVTGLKAWCEEHQVPYAIRDHQGSLYHGWILTRPSSTPSPR